MKRKILKEFFFFLGGAPKKVGGDFYTAGRGYPPPPTFLSATTWRSPEEAGMNFERGLIRGAKPKKVVDGFSYSG